MAVIKCKMCGGDLNLIEGVSTAECEYCGSVQTVPQLDDEKKLIQFERAERLRKQCEFDKAAGIYETIVADFRQEAEAYWGLVLCKYGIEYVDDPATGKKIPTCHRSSFESIMEDGDFEQALENADVMARKVYREEAKRIEEIRKGIIAVSSNEQPYDIFICYKETDDNGDRTLDSVIAQDVYDALTDKGYRVFFSRITLEDKLGVEYEPYIFAALNSAKIMLAFGTDYEYFNAVWVKNEWSRFLKLMAKDKEKHLIPCYKGIDAYDMPKEFARLQAQDMGKVGAIQDLLRGVEKILPRQEQTVKETVVVQPSVPSAPGVDPLLERAFMFLEDGKWDEADAYCEKVLDISPKNAHAYLGKLMAELKVKKQGNLKECANPFDDKNNYQKAFRFADDQLKNALAGYIEHIKTRNKERAEVGRKDGILLSARNKMGTHTIPGCKEALELFKKIPGWKDADEQLKACEKKIQELEIRAKEERQKREKQAEEERIAYEQKVQLGKKVAVIGAASLVVLITFLILLTKVFIPNSKYKDAVKLMNDGEYVDAMVAFYALDGYRDSAEKITECETAMTEEKYCEAIALMEAGKYQDAILAFELLGNYKDSAAKIEECNYNHAVATADAGEKVKAIMLFNAMGDYRDAKQQSRTLWDSIAVRETISAGYFHTVGLKSDGTVVAVSSNSSGRSDVSGWRDIVAISAGENATVGLKADGTVVAVGVEYFGQCDVSDWMDIVAISAGLSHTVGLKADGTVVAVGYNNAGQCNVSNWTDIVAISAGYQRTVGLKADGTVVAVGYNSDGQCDVSGWTDIVAICAGYFHTVGLKADGTVVAVGYDDDGRCDVSGWTDIVAISAGLSHTVGLKADGTVVATEYTGDEDDYRGQCEVSDWTGIVAIGAGDYHTVGLKADGTVVAVGYNNEGQCNVSDWTGIKVPQT